MPAKSKSQQRLMGWVNACKSGKAKNCPENIKKIAKSISKEDAKDFAETKHKGLPEVKESNNLTFIEYLAEVDRGDLQLAQQQSNRERQAGMQRTVDSSRLPSKERGEGNAYNDKMKKSSPDKGDMVIIKANRYLVIGGSMDGIKVKQLGGNAGATIPHGTKFELIGNNPNSGKAIFKVAQQ